MKTCRGCGHDYPDTAVYCRQCDRVLRASDNAVAPRRRSRTCEVCEAEIAAEATTCPYCGADQRRWSGRRAKKGRNLAVVEYVLVLACIAILVIVALRFMQPAISNTLNNMMTVPITIQSVTVTATRSGNSANTSATATVTIVDQFGQPEVGVTVNGTWSVSPGSPTNTLGINTTSATTDSYDHATFTAAASGSPTTYTFKVTNVAGSEMTWNGVTMSGTSDAVSDTPYPADCASGTTCAPHVVPPGPARTR